MKNKISEIKTSLDEINSRRKMIKERVSEPFEDIEDMLKTDQCKLLNLKTRKIKVEKSES